MSKIVAVHYKNNHPKNIKQKLYLICKQIEPDNIIANEPIIKNHQNDFLAIINPVEALQIKENSILLGQINSAQNSWNIPKTELPNGSYGLFRNNDEFSEIITDACASRTIWYYHDTEVFISATSQRALILLLDSFEFNEQTIPWLLSTGTLGPGISWDNRINQVPPHSAILLDKDNWSIEIKTEQIKFEEIKKANSEHRADLLDVLQHSISNLNIDTNKWILPLSGGYDSRGILYFLKKSELPKTITWGLLESQNVKGNDAYVAKKLATTLGTSHKYYPNDISNEPIEVIINRFIKLGEGRIDHIGGYMDGFKIWKTLFTDGVQGTIRGDEGFGWTSVSSNLNVRIFLGCAFCSDFSNLNKLTEKYNLPAQVIPEYMAQNKGESLSSWRDRLYHEFRIPTVLSALSDLKLSYVEQITPLLNHDIIKVIRTLPDELRTEKKLFKIIVNSLKPKIEFAYSGANATQKEILRSKELCELLTTKLNSDTALSIFPTAFLQELISNLKIQTTNTPKKKRRIIQLAKKLLPTFIKNYWHSRPNPEIDNNLLAFRIYIIVVMHEVFTKGKKELHKQLLD